MSCKKCVVYRALEALINGNRDAAPDLLEIAHKVRRRKNHRNEGESFDRAIDTINKAMMKAVPVYDRCSKKKQKEICICYNSDTGSKRDHHSS